MTLRVLADSTQIRRDGKDSLDTNFDLLATTVDASEMLNTTDVGRLTSPLFSEEREVNANPFCVYGSETHSSVESSMRDRDPFSSIEKPVRDVMSFSSFERLLLKGERNRELKSVQLSHMEKERTLTRLSDAQAELDRREWERRKAEIALHENGRQLESQRMKLHLTKGGLAESLLSNASDSGKAAAAVPHGRKERTHIPAAIEIEVPQR